MIPHNSENPLVSIIVVTYNSAKFVIETLESARQQTYNNVELILTDDGSKDDTIRLCSDWIEKNKSRFKRAELITVNDNTGIPANCNRGLNASRGEFLKFIAGDDIILPRFIEKSLKHLQKDSEIAVTYTNSKIIDEKSNFIRNLSSKQYKSGYIFKELFFVEFWPASPSFMFKRESIIKVGGFNENIAVEDYFLLLKLAQKYKIQHVNEYLTKYRLHSSNTSKNIVFLYKEHLKTLNEFKDYEGFNKRIKQLNTAFINSYSITNKKIALKLILKNLKSITFNIVWIKIFIKLLIPNKFKQWRNFVLNYLNKTLN